MVEKRSFEEALARLEEISGQLETGNLPLDDALAVFEEGISLVKFCGRRLQQAERKVEKLSQLPPELVEPRDVESL
jgi:exodeoxyribonuclease VII small subunit